jgi:hypothetical protein
LAAIAGCIDGDSDAFHYIGYAESHDLIHWTVVNGINNPIISTAPFTIQVNSSGVPVASGVSITVPSQAPAGERNRPLPRPLHFRWPSRKYPFSA